MRGAGRSQTMDIDIDERYLSAMPGPQSLSSPQSRHTPRLLLARQPSISASPSAMDELTRMSPRGGPSAARQLDQAFSRAAFTNVGRGSRRGPRGDAAPAAAAAGVRYRVERNTASEGAGAGVSTPPRRRRSAEDRRGSNVAVGIHDAPAPPPPPPGGEDAPPEGGAAAQRRARRAARRREQEEGAAEPPVEAGAGLQNI